MKPSSWGGLGGRGQVASGCGLEGELGLKEGKRRKVNKGVTLD